MIFGVLKYPFYVLKYLSKNGNNSNTNSNNTIQGRYFEQVFS